jgi:hypothetical protein
MEQVQRASFQTAWAKAQKTPNDFTDDTRALEALSAQGPLHGIFLEAHKLVNKQAAAALEQSRASADGARRSAEHETTVGTTSYSGGDQNLVKN